MRGMSALLLWLVLLSAPVFAQQNPNSGNFWLAECSNPTSIPCGYYLNGIDEFHTFISGAGGRKLYCAPYGVTIGQFRAVALKFLSENPARLHEPFIGLLLESLIRAFPCR